MVWYRTSSYAHRSPQTYTACVAWCGIGHQAMHIVHLKPTWCVWHGVVLDIKLCTSFTSNIHGVCGMVWYWTIRVKHRLLRLHFLPFLSFSCSLFQGTFCALPLLLSRFDIHFPDPRLSPSYLSRSLADRWGTTVDFTTSFLHSSRLSAFRSMIFHSRPVHSLMLSSHGFLRLPLHLPP